MNIYDKLGVKRLINGLATLTMYGGSIMPLEVLDAMREASQYFVTIPDLHKAVGDRIAKLTNNEAAFVCDGAAAGMVMAAAAIIAGDDEDRRMQLPDSEGMKNEVLVCKTFNPRYSHAIRIGGGKIIEYGSEDGASIEDLEAGFTDKTAAVFYFTNDDLKDKVPSVAQVAAAAHKRGVPVVVDAAAQIPPIENLWRYTGDGADIAIFSGGKGLRGPQASGLIVGKKEIVDVIATYACPAGGVGRPLKVGKEEIIGLMTAIELAVSAGTEGMLKLYRGRVEYVLDVFKDDDAVTTDKTETTDVGKPFPTALIIPVEGKLKITPEEIVQQLKDGDPAIYLGARGGKISMNPQCLLDGEEKIIAAALKKIIDANRI